MEKKLLEGNFNKKSDAEQALDLTYRPKVKEIAPGKDVLFSIERYSGKYAIFIKV